MSAYVLIVDDDQSVCVALKHILSAHRYRTQVAYSGEEGLEICAQEMPDLILLDIRLPGMSGIEMLCRIREMPRSCKVVVMTAYESVSTVEEARRLGAEEYLIKPMNLQDVLGVTAKLIGRPGSDRLARGKGLDEVIGEGEPMRQVFEMVHRISKTAATVLISGESGTGKEAVARAIHQNSDRADRPFISLSCASIPGNLLETELFGYEKGAFTDAKVQKQGLIEVAGEGTLLLDEIGLMPLDLQGKILTVLETRRFRRVGGTEEFSSGVRFFAATNADLKQAVAAGKFREDLYYRLYVIPIQLPPLRERGDDILLLARHFLKEFCRRYQKGLRALSADAEALLMAHPWPGNVRELKNVIERAVLLTDGLTLEASDLSIGQRGRDREPKGEPVTVSDAGLIRISFPPWGLPLEDIERQVIEAALRHTGGNISQAARLLHISRYALRYRMEKHGIGFSSEEADGQDA